MTDQTEETPGTDVATTERPMTPERLEWLERRELERVEERRAEVERLASSGIDSWAIMVRHAADLAAAIAHTDFVPESLRGNEAAVAGAVLYGRELGLPPMTTLQNIASIHGSIGMSAEILRSMILSAGHELRWGERTGGRCEVMGRRKGSQEWTTVVYTIDDARAAGLLEGKQGSTWRKYPRQKLIARASAELARIIFPDVTNGMPAVDELDDPDAEPETTPAATTAPVKRAQTSRTRKAPKPAAEPAAGDPAPPAAPAAAAEPAAAPTTDAPPLDDAPPAPPSRSENVKPEPVPDDAPPPPEDGDEPVVDDHPAPRQITSGQQRMIRGLLSSNGVKGGEEQRRALLLLHGARFESSTELTTADATTIIDSLKVIEERGEGALEALLDEEARLHPELLDQAKGDEQ